MLFCCDLFCCSAAPCLCMGLLYSRFSFTCYTLHTNAGGSRALLKLQDCSQALCLLHHTISQLARMTNSTVSSERGAPVRREPEQASHAYACMPELAQALMKVAGKAAVSSAAALSASCKISTSSLAECNQNLLQPPMDTTIWHNNITTTTQTMQQSTEAPANADLSHVVSVLLLRLAPTLAKSRMPSYIQPRLQPTNSTDTNMPEGQGKDSGINVAAAAAASQAGLFEFRAQPSAHLTSVRMENGGNSHAQAVAIGRSNVIEDKAAAEAVGIQLGSDVQWGALCACSQTWDPVCSSQNLSWFPNLCYAQCQVWPTI